MIEIIEVNVNGDYKIKYNGKYIKCNGIVEIYQANEDLTARLNPNIIDMLDGYDVVHTEYKEPVITFDDMKLNKLNQLRTLLDGSFEYDNVFFEVADINKFTLVMVGSDDDILAELPISTDGEYLIDTVKKVKDLKKAYLTHSKYYGKKITDCIKAKTIAELENI